MYELVLISAQEELKMNSVIADNVVMSKSNWHDPCPAKSGIYERCDIPGCAGDVHLSLMQTSNKDHSTVFLNCSYCKTLPSLDIHACRMTILELLLPRLEADVEVLRILRDQLRETTL